MDVGRAYAMLSRSLHRNSTAPLHTRYRMEGRCRQPDQPDIRQRKGQGGSLALLIWCNPEATNGPRLMYALHISIRYLSILLDNLKTMSLQKVSSQRCIEYVATCPRFFRVRRQRQTEKYPCVQAFRFPHACFVRWCITAGRNGSHTFLCRRISLVRNQSRALHRTVSSMWGFTIEARPPFLERPLQ